MRVRVGSWLMALLLAGLARADEPFAIRLDDTVYFFGDQLTQRGQYIDFVRSFVAVRYPHLKTVLWRPWGQPAATAESTLRRLDDTLRFHHPSVAVVCLGLNDFRVSQRPTEDRLEAFRDNLGQIVSRLQADGVQVWLVTPCPLDRPTGDGATRPLAELLARFAEAVRQIAEQHSVGVIDWYRIQSEEAEVIRREFPGYRYAEGPTEPVFPGVHGHATLAYSILKVWNAEPIQAEVTIDWPLQQVRLSAGRVGEARWLGDRLEARLLELPMPWPLGGHARRHWKALELSAWTLRATGLPAERMVLAVDGAVIPVRREELAEGLNLTAFPAVGGHRDLRSLLEGLRLTSGVASLRIEPPPKLDELREPYERMQRAILDYQRAKGRALLRRPRVISSLSLTLAIAEQPESRPATRGAATGSPR